MPRYTDDSKDKVREAVDFVDLVGRYTELRRVGGDNYQGCCPFHDERTPSFGIKPSDKVYFCFGCGARGDIFSFVMQKEGLDFVSAMEWLADRSGIELVVAEEDPDAARRRKARERLLAIIERTTVFYERYLWDSAEAAGAREYLRERGLSEEQLKRFRVGFSPSAWDKVLMAGRQAGYSEKELYDAGLVQRNSRGRVYDRFRGRVMFPLNDRRGRIIGFGARKMGDGEGPKYINTSESAVFHKGENLYASHLARAAAAKSGRVILCEGYTDVIALHQVGIENAVAQMGTALTPEQVGELSRLAPVVLLALDADNAGQEAMLKAAKVAEGRDVELRVITMEGGKDPADIVLEPGGVESLQRSVDSSVRFVVFNVRRILDRADLSHAEGKDAAIAELAPVMKDVPPGALRSELLALIFDKTDIDEKVLERMLGAPRRSATVQQPRPRQQAPRPQQQANGAWEGFDSAAIPDAADLDPGGAGSLTSANDPLARAERAFLTACVAVPMGGAELLRGLDIDDVLVNELHRRAARHIITSPDRPAAGLEDDPQLASLMAELVVRAGDRKATRTTLDASLAQLRLAALDRRIDRARRTGDGDIPALARQRNQLQREVNEAIARSLAEEPKNE